MSARQATSATGTSRKRVFIVDDHPLVRSALVTMIEQELDLAVCGQAGAVSDAIAGITELQPDLVITDISMPGRSGVDLIAELKSSFPHIRVLAISAHEEAMYAERVLHAGGQGYISKREGMSNILRAMRSVLEGQIHFKPDILALLYDAFSGRSNSRLGVSVLSSRELEVLQLLGEGRNSHSIAAALGISVKTVDVHRQNLKEKLKLESGMELTCYAVRWVHSKTDSRTRDLPRNE